MRTPDSGRRGRRHRLIAGAKGTVLLGFFLSLSYTVGASLRLFSTTLERWALSVALTLFLAMVAVVIVVDWLLDALREPGE